MVRARRASPESRPPLQPPPDADRRMRELYELHGGALYRFLLRWTRGERQAAEDLLQETLVRAWKNLAYLNTDLTAVRPWLYTVARRIAVDANRAKKARPAEVGIEDMSAVSDGENEIDRLLEAHALRLALGRLSVDHRHVLVEIYYRGRSVSETARVLGVAEGTVKSRSHHALRALRKAIESVQALP